MKTIRLRFEKKVVVDARIQLFEDQVFLFANGHAPVRVINKSNRDPESVIRQAIEIFEKQNKLILQSEDFPAGENSLPGE